MRKVLWSVALCIVALTAPVEAISIDTSMVPKWEAIRESIIALGKNILTYNKPVFETKLTQQERRISKRRLSDKLWDKVCAKNKTLVAGAVLANKKFGPECIVIQDPELVLVGGIRVGSSTSVLEKFFKKPLDEINMGTEKDEIVWSSAGENWGESITFLHKDGKIRQISYVWQDEDPTSEKTRAFVKRKMKELGLSEDSGFRMRYP